jgi:tRNA (Thr-GGU) A37 N-methylase
MAKKSGGSRRKPVSPSSVRVRPVGVIRSALKARGDSPRQGSEGAPDAWLEIAPFAAQATEGLVVGDEIVLLTWLHQGNRRVRRVHPRGDRSNPIEAIDGTPVIDVKPQL